MIRRRFYSSYKSPVDNGVYAVKQDGRLIPLSKADYQCISVAIVHDDHKIMIEKNEDSNQSHKTATSGLPDSSNKTYSFYWGEYGTDQTGITNYDKVDGSNDFGFLKPGKIHTKVLHIFRMMLAPGRMGLYLIGMGKRIPMY